MACQSVYNSKWENALKEGLVWSCIAFAGSWLFFPLGFLLKSIGLDSDSMRYLCLPSNTMIDFLIAKNILSNENVLGAVLMTLVSPWMAIGFVFGACRGFFFKPSPMSERDGCLKASFYVVLAVLAGVVLIFVY